MNEQKLFNYSYSSTQQKEVEAIRKKYTIDIKKNNDGAFEQLRKLDKNVTDKAMIPALIVGIAGTLIMGLGMSLIMSDLGIKLDIENAMITGVIIGFIGVITVINAYPLYCFILKKERKKAAPHILRLAEELLQK